MKRHMVSVHEDRKAFNRELCRDMSYRTSLVHERRKTFICTGTPPLTRFFGPGKNRVKGKPCYRRSI